MTEYNHAKDCKGSNIYRAYAYDDDRDFYNKEKAYACRNCGHITYIRDK